MMGYQMLVYVYARIDNRPAKLKNTKIARARSLKARGFSAQETAQALSVSRRTVLRYLKSN